MKIHCCTAQCAVRQLFGIRAHKQCQIHFAAVEPAPDSDALCYVMGQMAESLWRYNLVLLPLEGLADKLNVQSEEVA
jgi:hypothetical protein